MILEHIGLSQINGSLVVLDDVPGVSYDEVRAFKETYFRKAFYEFKKNFASFQQEYDRFCRECEWLEDYAVFITFKKLNGMKAWTEWPLEMREWPKRHSIDLEPYGNDIFYEKFLQYMFYTQWVEIRDHAHEKGIRIMGDIPFYVGLDSVDVWVNRDCFLLEEDGTPSYVAGVPPDYFSESGQRWGNPIYDWKQMEKDGTDHVWLSMEKIDKETILEHFPNIYQHCLEEGYDVTKECIPVVPAQHYFMGGIWVDSDSRTSMEHLFAVGETSCNGVHGANRLASNSLLESLVFAKRAAKKIACAYGNSDAEDKEAGTTEERTA